MTNNQVAEGGAVVFCNPTDPWLNFQLKKILAVLYRKDRSEQHVGEILVDIIMNQRFIDFS